MTTSLPPSTSPTTNRPTGKQAMTIGTGQLVRYGFAGLLLFLVMTGAWKIALWIFAAAAALYIYAWKNAD